VNSPVTDCGGSNPGYSNALSTSPRPETEDDLDPGCLREDARPQGQETENQPGSSHAPQQNIEALHTYDSRIEEIQATRELLTMIRNAKLDDTHCNLGADFVSRLRNPPTVLVPIQRHVYQ
jgi:hypothetical protein